MLGRIETLTPKEEPNRLSLCFDETDNNFTGPNGGTTPVKFLTKLDRNHAPRVNDQYLLYFLYVRLVLPLRDQSISHGWAA